MSANFGPPRHRRLLGAAISLAVAVALSAPVSAHAASRAADLSGATTAAVAPQPIVSGNVILDSTTGEVFVPHAVNWPSFEYACQQGWGESADGATAAAAAAMVSWGINAVRIPLNQDCWLGVDGAPAIGTPAAYKSALSAWVSILNQAGLVVILDLHWTAPSGSRADGQRAMPDGQSTIFWSQVSAAYKSSPSVLFETFNEPYSRGSYTVSWSCWKNGGCRVPIENDGSATLSGTSYTAVGQATLVAAIRASGASQPILLDGLNYANDLTGWLASKPNDPQLIASWHNYPGQGCSTATCWNSEVVPLAASVPVITTEFGMTTTDPTFFTDFMNWADARGIGYAPWAWWVTDASDPAAAQLYSLLSNLTSFTARAPEGTTYQQHLASLTTPLAPTSAVPVFRFWSPENKTHFYTASSQERDLIIATYAAQTWTYEGIGFSAFTTQVAGTVPLFRFWSSTMHGHFYTSSVAEKNHVMATYPSNVWNYEGVAFYVYPSASMAPNTMAVSRFWSQQDQQHFYTSSVDEKNLIIATYSIFQWSYEGDDFRVPVS